MCQGERFDGRRIRGNERMCELKYIKIYLNNTSVNSSITSSVIFRVYGRVNVDKNRTNENNEK